MPTQEEIIQTLCQLDTGALEIVINEALRQRSNAPGASSPAMPGPEEGPEPFARWLAHRHLSTDPAIQWVVYLPTGAPNDEVRLLEINRFLQLDDDDVIEPVDFTPDDDLTFKVFVADVASDQWERIQQGQGPSMPPGWQLEGYRVYSRG